MGKTILDIPELQPTELILVDFSAAEGQRYRYVKSGHSRIRGQPRIKRGGSKGDSKRLFNWLRFFTSHPALVEPTFFLNQPQPAETQPEKEQDRPAGAQFEGTDQLVETRLDGEADQPAGTQPKGESKLTETTTGTIQAFCRICSKVLVEPHIGDVSTSSFALYMLRRR